MLADRQADRIDEVLKRSKGTSSTVSDKELSDAAKELFGMVRSLELMGISREKAATAMSDLNDALLGLVTRKTQIRNELVKRRDIPNSGVTDADVDRAEAELQALKQQVRRLGIAVP